MNRRGIVYAVLAYGGWGLLPMYWKLFASLSATEVLAHRIVWSALFVWAMLAATGRLKAGLRVAQDRRHLLWMGIGAGLITINWLTYIYAVNSGHIVEASLGYYINPLVSVLLGIVFLHERLNGWQWGALAVAAAGVAISVWAYGRFPWLAISLALSFGLYGLAKKKVSVEAMESLTWETTLVLPLALLYLAGLHLAGVDGGWHLPALRLVLLLLSGVATALPLLWFGMAAKALNLTTLGFVQYLSPTISLLLGVFVYRESFTALDLLAFACIWMALVLYSVSSLRHAMRRVGGMSAAQ
ncbi:EamA family transporter RarD [Alicyclobacillus sp.]|uniref:EamA family transporter RarD n=1 Tax=Alicyclobacillus sp. TaxID=61169 RepID=UPI0025C18CBF|nr:EamA family transporter RarD [Alicyclobacillus sp.]MCL6515335.1 EamA family transporter RarD [Alicyclobacillus sp.]